MFIYIYKWLIYVSYLNPVYTRAKVSGFVKISGFHVFQVYGVYTAQREQVHLNSLQIEFFKVKN